MVSLSIIEEENIDDYQTDTWGHNRGWTGVPGQPCVNESGEGPFHVSVHGESLCQHRSWRHTGIGHRLRLGRKIERTLQSRWRSDSTLIW